MAGGSGRAGQAMAGEAAVDAANDAAEAYRVVHPRRFLQKFMEEEVRPDGRGLDGFRRCTVAMGEIGTADGSAIVRLGETAVIAGIKAEIANPPIDSPDTGWLVPNVTLPRMCSPNVKQGPPGLESQTLSHYIATVLDTAVDKTQLCIAAGKLSWVLHLTVVVLNEDGNLTDACTLAAVAALRDLRLPRLSAVGVDDETMPTVEAERAIALTLSGPPVAVSFAQCSGQMLADPTSFEETLASQTITLVQQGLDGSMAGVLQPSPSAGPTVGSAVVNTAAVGVDPETLKSLYAQASRRAVEMAAILDKAADAHML